MFKDFKITTHALLRRSERYTRTDMVYLTSGGFWLFLKTFLVGLISLTLSVAFANLLPQHIYGEYKYIFSIFSFLAITTLVGMGTSTTKSVAQGFEGTPAAALKSKIRWATIGSAVSACLAGYYFVQGNLGLSGAFALVTLFLPFVDTLSIFNSVLTGKKLFRISTIAEVVIQGFSAAAIIVALFLTDALVIILATYFVAYTTIRLAVFKYVIKKYAANTNIDASAIAYGKKLSGMEILSIAAETLETVLLWQFIGPAPLAVYAFSKGIPAQISAALQRITTLALPKFATRDLESIKQPLTYKMLLMFIIMVGIVVAYITLAPLIFKILFPKYMEAVFYSQLFALTLLFFPQKFIGTLFQAHAYTKALYISSTITPLTRITLSIVLIPMYGILGAIIAELCARTVNLITVTLLYYHARNEHLT